MKIYQITLCILFLVFGCSPQPNEERLELILSSKKYTVQIISSRGNISGRPTRNVTEEKFTVSTFNNKHSAEYHLPSSYSDSIFVFNLNKQEVDSLHMLMKAAVDSHNPKKEYDGCCMCRNVDFNFYNESIKIEVKPSKEVEYFYEDLTKKYNEILYKKSQEYYKSL